MSRKGWSSLPIAVMCAAPALWPAQAVAQTVVKIGLINSYSGFAPRRRMKRKRISTFTPKLHEKGLPPDVKIDLIRRGDTSNPEVGKRLAQELIAREHIQLLAGVTAAIAALTAEAKVPLLLAPPRAASRCADLALCRPRHLHAVADGLSDRQMGGARLEEGLHRGRRFHSRP